jgi:hypothetical protein
MFVVITTARRASVDERPCIRRSAADLRFTDRRSQFSRQLRDDVGGDVGVQLRGDQQRDLGADDVGAAQVAFVQPVLNCPLTVGRWILVDRVASA